MVVVGVLHLREVEILLPQKLLALLELEFMIKEILSKPIKNNKILEHEPRKSGLMVWLYPQVETRGKDLRISLGRGRPQQLGVEWEED